MATLPIPTVSLVLRKKYADDTMAAIRLCVYDPSTFKQIFKPTGYKVNAAHWDSEEQRVKKACPDADLINYKIQQVKAELQEAFKEDLRTGVTFTKEHILSRLQPPSDTGDFLTFYREHIAYLRSKKLTAAYCNHFEIEYNRIKAYGGETLSFRDINSRFLEGYEMSVSKYANNTINTIFKRLKEIIDKGIVQEKIRPSVLAGYKWPNYQGNERLYLTLGQTEQIGDAIYKGDFLHDPQLNKVACFFLVECYAGIRFSDWGRFSVETLVKDRNLKVRAKKNGEPVYLPLKVFKRLGKIVGYIEKNNLTFDVPDYDTNRKLKIVAAHCGIKLHLTTHIGRHTCGTLLGEMGYSTRAIADVLGISEQTAKVYVKATKQGLNFEFSKYGGL